VLNHPLFLSPDKCASWSCCTEEDGIWQKKHTHTQNVRNNIRNGTHWETLTDRADSLITAHINTQLSLVYVMTLTTICVLAHRSSLSHVTVLTHTQIQFNISIYNVRAVSHKSTNLRCRQSLGVVEIRESTWEIMCFKKPFKGSNKRAIVNFKGVFHSTLKVLHNWNLHNVWRWKPQTLTANFCLANREYWQEYKERPNDWDIAIN